MFGTTKVPCKSSENMFTMSVDSAGSIKSVQTLPFSIGGVVCRRVLDSASNVFETGRLNANVFVTKHSGDGVLLWEKYWGGRRDDAGTAVVVDSSENVIVAGYFTESITLEGETLSNVNGGRTDSFIVKLDNDGNKVWAAQIGGPGSAMISGIAVDELGSVFVTGWFDGIMLFGPAGHDGLTSTGDRDIFVAKLDVNGKLLWVHQAGGIGADAASGIAVDSLGGVFVTGSFSQTAKFGKVILDSSGSHDIFWMKLHEEHPHAREFPIPPKVDV